MKTGTRIQILMLSLALYGGLEALADEIPPTLTVNPFSRPAWLSDARTASTGQLTTPNADGIDLRATLMAGKASLANVGGKIIGIGEEVDGYKLVSIDESAAVFSYDDGSIRVSVPGTKKDKKIEAE